MFSSIARLLGRPNRTNSPPNSPPTTGKIAPTVYTSREVDIPETFLRGPAPVTYKVIDFSQTAVPELDGRWAAVLDGVLNPAECAELLRLAEASVEGTGPPWRPALVNAGQGREVLLPNYRNSDRIIWDTQEVMDRLWARIASVPEIRDKLASVDGEWDFSCINKRGRFLRYGPGQFFKAHTDGSFHEERDGREYCTFYTIQLYLNDSVDAFDTPEEAAAAGATLRGGATPFLSRDERRRVDVFPKAGRLLIFQHDGLYHSGAPVDEGVKYTMRSDILFVKQQRKGVRRHAPLHSALSPRAPGRAPA